MQGPEGGYGLMVAFVAEVRARATATEQEVSLCCTAVIKDDRFAVRSVRLYLATREREREGRTERSVLRSGSLTASVPLQPLSRL